MVGKKRREEEREGGEEEGEQTGEERRGEDKRTIQLWGNTRKHNLYLRSTNKMMSLPFFFFLFRRAVSRVWFGVCVSSAMCRQQTHKYSADSGCVRGPGRGGGGGFFVEKRAKRVRMKNI